MAIVLVYFHTPNSLHDFKLFTRKFYPSGFEPDSRMEYSNGRLFLVLSQEKHSPASSLFDCSPDVCVCNQNDNNSLEDSIEIDSKAKSGTSKCCHFFRQQQRKQESYFQLCPSHQACLTLDGHVASCAAHELALSRIFRKKFFMYAKSKSGFSSDDFNNFDCHDDIGFIWIPYVIEIQLEYPKQKIDFSWFYRIQGLVILKVKTEESMALLSTLGGGFSALGDYDQKHSLEAGKIAMRQLKIAILICDPLIASRCYLYLSLSLMQRGYLKEARFVIRKQYSFAKNHFIKDYRLVMMCKGLWARLQFMYYLRRLKKQGIPCSVQHGILDDYYSSYNTCGIWHQTNGQDESRIQVRLGAS